MLKLHVGMSFRLLLVCTLYIFASIDAYSGEANAATRTNPVVVSIRIGTPLTPPSWLVHIAIANKYFLEHDLDVKVTPYKSGKLALEGLFKNEVDVAVCAEEPIVYYSMQRNDFRLFSIIGSSSNDNMIVARKDRNILHAKDLKGKKVATQHASASHFFLHIFLVNIGLTTNDIILIFANVEQLPKLLASGQVDAISTREPFLSETINTLGDNALVLPAPGLHLKSFGLVSLGHFIDKNPITTQKILLALLQAEQFSIEKKQQSIDVLAKILNISPQRVTDSFKGLELHLKLSQSLISQLEDAARWVITNKLSNTQTVPNYLDFISTQALEIVKPEAMTINKRSKK